MFNKSADRGKMWSICQSSGDELFCMLGNRLQYKGSVMTYLLNDGIEICFSRYNFVHFPFKKRLLSFLRDRGWMLNLQPYK